MIRDSLRRRVSALEHDRQEREQKRQAARWQAFADELGERVRVEINGEAIRTVEKAACPHCARISAELLRLATNAGDLLLHSERPGGPFQPINYPSADRRWRTAPHIEAPIACECGGDFEPDDHRPAVSRHSPFLA